MPKEVSENSFGLVSRSKIPKKSSGSKHSPRSRVPKEVSENSFGLVSKSRIPKKSSDSKPSPRSRVPKKSSGSQSKLNEVSENSFGLQAKSKIPKPIPRSRSHIELSENSFGLKAKSKIPKKPLAKTNSTPRLGKKYQEEWRIVDNSKFHLLFSGKNSDIAHYRIRYSFRGKNGKKWDISPCMLYDYQEGNLLIKSRKKNITLNGNKIIKLEIDKKHLAWVKKTRSPDRGTHPLKEMMSELKRCKRDIAKLKKHAHFW